MRPGRKDDLPRLMELWRREVLAGRQDAPPNEARLRRMLETFDWEARSRVVDDGDGRIAGCALVTARPSPDGVLANVHLAGEPGVADPLARWGTQLSRASGAAIVQIFQAGGRRASLEGLGLKIVRPWWRMDRSFDAALPNVPPVNGYALVDAASTSPGSWAEMFNRSFSDHWRFVPRYEEEIVADKAPELCLMAVTARDRVPAAITLGEIEAYPDDRRPQPVGLVSSVGTVPEHRRRGLASWLVAEILARLKAAGARSASLYVDGLNEMRAFDAYRKLGFEVAFETDVWEATFP
jgi:ribosomal protein S18 acetylase RimI-like enzyme